MDDSGVTDIGLAGLLVLIGTGISMFSNFLFRLLGARFLTPSEFGSVVVGISMINILSVVCLFGLNQGLVRFVSSESDIKIKNSYITVSIAFVVLVSMAALIFGVFFDDLFLRLLFDSNTDPLVLYLFLCALPFYALFKLIGGVLRGNMDSKNFVRVAKLARPLTLLIFSAALVFFFNTSTSLAFGFLLSISITTIWGIWLLLKNGWRPRIRYDSDYRQLFYFSAPLVISSSVFILLSYLDKILIGLYMSNQDVAIYEVAVTIASLLGLFRSAFGFLLYPKISEAIQGDSSELISEMYSQTTKWILFLTTPAFAILIIRPEILIHLFGDQYQIGTIAPVIAVLAVGLFLNAVVGPNGEAMLGFGRSRSVLVYNLSSVILNIALNILLIPTIGLLGAAVASVCGYLIMNLFKSVDLYLRNGITVVSIKSVNMSAVMFLFSAILLEISPDISSMVGEFSLISLVSVFSLLLGVFVLWLTGGITRSDKTLLTTVLDKLPGRINYN
ncbi:flippase [Haloferax volcanii]|uniref:Flippase n=1 Tax=Haloferax volcanii TaxID=2246 RepID=A0A6C0UZ96_HALVO|nr:flippase [Haloferax alexandrinus]QIB79139.1 flippase [Haloferax alexandrinus]